MNERGLEAPLSAHFGSAPYYTVVDTETGGLEVVANGRAEHEHGQCNPVSQISRLAPDAVVCMGLGRRALDRLQAAGIQVFLAKGTQVAGVVAEFRSGALSPFGVDSVCAGNHVHGNGGAGRGHHGIHDHAHGHGQGQGGGAGSGRGWGPHEA